MVAIQQIPVQQSAQAQLLRSQTMRAPSTTRDGKRKAVTAAEANAIIDKMLAGANGSAVDENTSAAGDSNTSLGKLVRHPWFAGLLRACTLALTACASSVCCSLGFALAINATALGT